MLDNIFPGVIIADCIFNKLLINLLLGFILHDLLHVLHDVWELIQDALESFSVVLQG